MHLKAKERLRQSKLNRRWAILNLWPLVIRPSTKTNRSVGSMGLSLKIFQYLIISALRSLPLTEYKSSRDNRWEYGNSLRPSICLVHLRWTPSSFLMSPINPVFQTHELNSRSGLIWLRYRGSMNSFALHRVEFRRLVDRPAARETTESIWQWNFNWFAPGFAPGSPAPHTLSLAGSFRSQWQRGEERKWLGLQNESPVWGSRGRGKASVQPSHLLQQSKSRDGQSNGNVNWESWLAFQEKFHQQTHLIIYKFKQLWAEVPVKQTFKWS